MPRALAYLALGDSYTIGEGVAAADRWPLQLAACLRDAGIALQDPRIIATTGWTTDELAAGIGRAHSDDDPLKKNYDFVTLLIGVNNQYRGRSIEEYKTQFEELLKQAILFAHNRPQRVVVLSIPDWGITPFAAGSDRQQIAREIDAFNAANKAIANQYHTYYIDITPGTREAATDNSLLAADGLHPSGKEYSRWAARIAAYFRSVTGH